MNKQNGSENKSNALKFLVLASNGNIGDYAMLSSDLKRLRHLFPESSISVIANSFNRSFEPVDIPKYTYGNKYFSSKKSLFSRILSRSRKGYRLLMLIRCAAVIYLSRLKSKRLIKWFLGDDCLSMIEMIRDASCVISCGGGYLNSIWWDKELWRKCVFYIVAAKMGVPVILSGQGIGPITSKLDAFMLKAGLSKVKWISLREKGEGELYLNSLDINENKYAAIGDDAIDVVPCAEDRLREIFRNESINFNRRLVIVNVRSTAYTNQYSNNDKQMFASLLDVMAEDHEIIFTSLSFDVPDGSDDRTAAFEIVKSMKNRQHTHILMDTYSAEEVKGIISRGEISFGLSYHFAVFALSQGIPCLSFFINEYYRLKYKGLYAFFRNADWYYKLDDNGINAALKQVGSISSDIAAIKQSLLQDSAEMAKRVNAVYEKIKLDMVR